MSNQLSRDGWRELLKRQMKSSLHLPGKTKTFSGSVAHDNAVMFGYQLKPLYEGE